MSETPLTDAFGKEPSPFQPRDAAQLIPLWIDFARKLERDRARLKDLLDEVHDFLADQEDVVDGSYGQPRPNRAMSLNREIRAALASLEEK